MKPPICAVCNRRFEPAEGALVSFADDARSSAFAERIRAEPGFVGHRPNTEWFCGDHSEAARALASGTSGDALSVLRAALTDAQPEPAPVPTVDGLRVSPIVRRKRRSDAEPGMVAAELPAGIDVFALHERLRAFRPVMMAALGLPDEIEVQTRTTRTWNPMDGAREPNCPYSDRVTDEAEIDGIEQSVEVESNWWNPNNLSNASARLAIVRRPSRTEWATYICRITGGTGHLSGGPAIVPTLSVEHPDVADIEELIVGFAAGLSLDTSAT